MTTPKEFVEDIRKGFEKDIDNQITGFNFEHPWILRRVTSYVDNDGKARVAFNFEVRLDE